MRREKSTLRLFDLYTHTHTHTNLRTSRYAFTRLKIPLVRRNSISQGDLVWIPKNTTHSAFVCPRKRGTRRVTEETAERQENAAAKYPALNKGKTGEGREEEGGESGAPKRETENPGGRLKALHQVDQTFSVDCPSPLPRCGGAATAEIPDKKKRKKKKGGSGR